MIKTVTIGSTRLKGESMYRSCCAESIREQIKAIPPETPMRIHAELDSVCCGTTFKLIDFDGYIVWTDNFKCNQGHFHG